MDILLILVLFFMAWLGGHALDYAFTQVEKAVKPAATEKETIYEPGKATNNEAGKQPARLYLVPSATPRH